MNGHEEYQKILGNWKKIKFNTYVSTFCLVLTLVWIVCGFIVKGKDVSNSETIGIIMIIVGVVFLVIGLVINVYNSFSYLSLKLPTVNHVNKMFNFSLNIPFIWFVYFNLNSYIKKYPSSSDYEIIYLNHYGSNNTQNQENVNSTVPPAINQQQNSQPINEYNQQAVNNTNGMIDNNLNQNQQQEQYPNHTNYSGQEYSQPINQDQNLNHSYSQQQNEQQPIQNIGPQNVSYPQQVNQYPTEHNQFQNNQTRKVPPVWNGSVDASNQALQNQNNENNKQ